MGTFFLINHDRMLETSNQQFIMKVDSYFCKSFSFVFITFGFKLHNEAQVNIMSTRSCIIVTGMVRFKILKFFFSVYSSFNINSQICYFLCFLNLTLLASVIWLSLLHQVEQPIYKNEKANLLQFENPCLPLLHHLFLINHKTHYLW